MACYKSHHRNKTYSEIGLRITSDFIGYNKASLLFAVTMRDAKPKDIADISLDRLN